MHRFLDIECCIDHKSMYVSFLIHALAMGQAQDTNNSIKHDQSKEPKLKDVHACIVKLFLVSVTFCGDIGHVS